MVVVWIRGLSLVYWKGLRRNGIVGEGAEGDVDGRFDGET
jgi:hypothetical protein